MEDRARDCVAAVRRLFSIEEQNLRALSRETGLSPQLLLVMRTIDEFGAVTPKTIAQKVGVAPATATALIEKLHRLDYVRRERGTSDRRMYWVSLTETGRTAFRDTPDPLSARFTRAFATLPDWEQAMIIAVLERTADLMGDDKPAPTPAAARRETAGQGAPSSS